MRFHHLCNTVKSFHVDIYEYLKTNDLDPKLVDSLRNILAHILISNQCIINNFTVLVKKKIGSKHFNIEYEKGVFPKYLNKIQDEYPDIVKDHTDIINKEIENIEPKDIRFTKTMYQKRIKTIGNLEILDLTYPYKLLIQLIKYHNLPKKWLEKAETTYYITSILNLILKKVRWKPIIPDKPLLFNRANSFIATIEKTLIMKETDLKAFSKLVIHEGNKKILNARLKDPDYIPPPEPVIKNSRRGGPNGARQQFNKHERKRKIKRPRTHKKYE